MFAKIELTNCNSMTELSREILEWQFNSPFSLAFTTYSAFIWCVSHLTGDKKPELSNSAFFYITLALFGFTIKGLHIYLDKMIINENINKKTAFDFYTLHSHYPEKNTIHQSIFCPILQGHSNKPICISYHYKNSVYTHTFDYPSLIQWFSKNTTCPSNNIDLLLADVTNLNFSFDIPPNFLIEEELTDEDNANLMRI